MANKEVIKYDKKQNNMVTNKEGKGKQGFITEIDNYIEAGTINNALYGPLFSKSGEPLG